MSTSYTQPLADAHAALKQAQALINAEISSYPTPISGCDAQFNHLIGERQRIASALSAMRQAVFVPTPRIPTPGAAVESR